MDTISRENNSMLPVFGVVAGVIGLILGGIGLVQASKANKALEALQPKIDKIDTVEGQVNTVSGTASSALKEVRDLKSATQAGFDQIGPLLVEMRTTVTRLEEAAKKPVVAEKGAGKSSGPVTAAPGEYVIKKGDIGTSIAKSHGVTVADLVAVNPSVNFSKLAIGQKIKLPTKK